jgi:hypothetical protein
LRPGEQGAELPGVDLRGADGVGSARGGGGGAGGGLLLSCDLSLLTGTYWLGGGAGGVGDSPANDSGGGGGGGRFKLFYESLASDLSYDLVLDGGLGGPYGTAGVGQNGQPGSATVVTQPWL